MFQTLLGIGLLQIPGHTDYDHARATVSVEWPVPKSDHRYGN